MRGALGTRAREVVSKLGLPNRIISFLSYMPPPVIEIESPMGNLRRSSSTVTSSPVLSADSVDLSPESHMTGS